MTRFGFTNPVLVDEKNAIVAGHGRVLAAVKLQIKEIPTIRLADLSAIDIRAYIIADNKLAENAGWDREILAIELQYLSGLDINFDVSLTGIRNAGD